MQIHHRRFNLGIFGMGGNGKTEYAIRYLANASASACFIFDPDGEFSLRMNLAPARTVFELDQAVKRGWVCFAPELMFEGRLEQGLQFFAEYALRASERMPGRKLFAVDELGQFMSGAAVPDEIKRIVQTGGRRGGLDGVFMAQQPNELHNTVRAQLTEVTCFQLMDETALEWLKKFGFDCELLKRLPPHEYVCRNKAGGQSMSAGARLTYESLGNSTKA